MVVFGNIIIANELFLLMVVVPVAFLYWYIQRVLKAQPTKAVIEYKTGNRRIFPALWNMTENSVTITLSRKEKLVVAKVSDPKMHVYSPVKREWQFLIFEGEKVTSPWESHTKNKDLQYDPAYVAIGETEAFVKAVRSGEERTFKGQMFGFIAGFGGGIGTGMMLMFLFGVV